MIKLLNIGTNYRIVKATCEDDYIELCYSHETLVAIRFPNGESYRIQPSPSATITKHLKKMGVYNWSLASRGWFETQALAIE